MIVCDATLLDDFWTPDKIAVAYHQHRPKTKHSQNGSSS